ncbi:MAG: MlaD family protein [Muribaculaceae bacterium]
MKKIFRKEVLIGLTAAVAMAILFIGIDFLKGVNVFKAANYYYATYTNVNGLAQSAPVTLNGFKVGQVRELSYDYDNPGHVNVELSLDRELKLPLGTRAVLASDLLGTASITLEFTDSKSYHAVGDKLEGVVQAGLMDNVSKELMPSVAAIFPKIDSLLTTVNTLVSDPALAASVQRLNAITANLEATTRSIHGVVASLPPVVNNVKSITGNFDAASADIAAVTTNLRNVPLDSIADNLAATTANLRLLTEQLNNPNSTLGLLTHDKALYNNLNTTISSLDSLFVDIKRNPKRYISIKLL